MPSILDAVYTGIIHMAWNFLKFFYAFCCYLKILPMLEFSDENRPCQLPPSYPALPTHPLE